MGCGVAVHGKIGWDARGDDNMDWERRHSSYDTGMAFGVSTHGCAGQFATWPKLRAPDHLGRPAPSSINTLQSTYIHALYISIRLHGYVSNADAIFGSFVTLHKHRQPTSRCHV